MTLRTTGPIFGLMSLRTINLSDQWPFGLLTIRTNGMIFGPMTLRTTDLSDYWPFGLVHDFRTNEPSDQRPFGISSCPHGDNPRPILGIAIGPSIWDRTLWFSNPTNVRERWDFQKIIPSMELWSYVRLSTRIKCDQHNEWCAIPKIGNSRFQNAAY